MLTYENRPMVLSLYGGQTNTHVEYPCEATAEFTMTPAMPFGGPISPGRTAPVGGNAHFEINKQTERTLVHPLERLDPIDITFELNGIEVSFANEICRVSRKCDSEADVHDMLSAFHYLLPLTLNLDFIDAPFIGTVDCVVGGVKFYWAIADQRSITIVEGTTARLQEEKLQAALQRLTLLGASKPGGRLRILAALHWFHIACRLERVGHSPWEFLAEILLNLAKILEVLFPPSGTGMLDSARVGLAALGFSTEEIECWYIPALAIRNSIDVAHASLAEFEDSDLEVLHVYSARAENRFRLLLRRICDRVETGEWELPEYIDRNPSTQALKTIERLRTLLRGVLDERRSRTGLNICRTDQI